MEKEKLSRQIVEENHDIQFIKTKIKDWINNNNCSDLEIEIRLWRKSNKNIYLTENDYNRLIFMLKNIINVSEPVTTKYINTIYNDGVRCTNKIENCIKKIKFSTEDYSLKNTNLQYRIAISNEVEQPNKLDIDKKKIVFERHIERKSFNLIDDLNKIRFDISKIQTKYPNTNYEFEIENIGDKNPNIQFMKNLVITFAGFLSKRKLY